MSPWPEFFWARQSRAEDRWKHGEGAVPEPWTSWVEFLDLVWVLIKQFKYVQFAGSVVDLNSTMSSSKSKTSNHLEDTFTTSWWQFVHPQPEHHTVMLKMGPVPQAMPGHEAAMGGFCRLPTCFLQLAEGWLGLGLQDLGTGNLWGPLGTSRNFWALLGTWLCCHLLKCKAYMAYTAYTAYTCHKSGIWSDEGSSKVEIRESNGGKKIDKDPTSKS